MREHDIIQRITEIRARNNDLWMSIAEIALDAAPEQTKAVMRQIADNDSAVNAMWRELTR
jgi:hypothetical protein